MTWIVLKFELEIHVVATYQKILLLYFWAKWFKNFHEIKNKKINWTQVEFIICFLWECLLYLMINMFSKLQIFIGSACKCIPRPLRILVDFKFLFTPIFWQFIKIFISSDPETAIGGVRWEKVFLVPESLFQQSCRPNVCNLLKKETLAQVFSCEFYEISKNTIFIEHLWASASANHIKQCRLIFYNGGLIVRFST